MVRSNLSRGFTLIEMLVIAPIVILAIGGFIAALVNMTGEVLSSRGSNTLAYTVQDALNRIEQDVKLSTTFLPETSIPFVAGTNPQGFGDGPAPAQPAGTTTAFANATGANGTALILGGAVTNGNPLAIGTGMMYVKNTPNDCSNPALYVNNVPMTMNIVYFIQNDTLWRRTIMPANYTDTNERCGGTPWQQPSCQPGSTYSFCKTGDVKLVEGVSQSGFFVQYYTAADSTLADTVAGVSSDAAARGTALRAASTVSVSIIARTSIAGRDVERSGTVRATRLDTNATAIANQVNPNVSGTAPNVSTAVVDGSNVAVTWPQLLGATTYSVDYRINGGTWTSGATGLTNSQRSYTVTAATHTNTVDVRVRGANAGGQLSDYGTAQVTIPLWAPLNIAGGWSSYSATYAPPSFTITSSGAVILKGLVKKASAAVNDEVLATLPPGYRPSERLLFTGYSNSAYSRLDVLTNGNIILRAHNAAWVTLDSVNFVPDGRYARTAVPSLTNGWSNYLNNGGSDPNTYAAVTYVVDDNSRVWLQGLAKAGTTANGTVMTTLPAGVRPSSRDTYTESQTDTLGARIEIASNGQLSVWNTTGATMTTNAVWYPAAFAGWTNMTLVSPWVSWAQFGTAMYAKGSDGLVMLRGFVQSGSLGTTVATLPSGYRPKEQRIFTTHSSGVVGRIDVFPDGRVVYQSGLGTQGAGGLSQIIFPAEQ